MQRSNIFIAIDYFFHKNVNCIEWFCKFAHLLN